MILEINHWILKGKNICSYKLIYNIFARGKKGEVMDCFNVFKSLHLELNPFRYEA